MLWQLPTASPPGGTTSLGLSMSFGPLDGAASGAYDPASCVTIGSSMAVRSYNNQPYLAFDGISPNGVGDGPWGRAASYTAGKLTLGAQATRYKLSFLVKASNTGAPGDQSYLSDPEVIVGSAG